jgi:hypothetical protein
MAGLVPAIHAFCSHKAGVDARDKHGHDAEAYPYSAPSRIGGWKASPVSQGK